MEPLEFFLEEEEDERPLEETKQALSIHFTDRQKNSLMSTCVT